MSAGHAFLAPSSAPLWVVCEAAPDMQRQFPETGDLAAAMDGTAAHWAFGELFRGQAIAVGQIAPNDVRLTDAMIEGAEMYVERVYADLAGWNVVRFHVEEPLSMSSIHPENWGTPDTWAFAHNATTGKARIFVWDYKYGHRFVDVFENWQLIDYVAGVIQELQIDGHADQLIDCLMTIVQPRNYDRDGPIRTWRTQASNLRAHFNILRGAAERANGPNPKAVVNPGCVDCSARGNCEALSRAAGKAADLARYSEPLHMSDHALGLELHMLRPALAALNARIDGLEATATARLMAGANVPFHRMAQGTARTVWIKPASEVIALGQLFGVDVAKPGTITPKQAIDKGLDASVIESFIDTPRGALKLVPDDGKLLRKVFGNND